MTMRNTRQKQIVSHVLHDAERPLTVQEILERAQKNLTRLGIATVYREIGRLREEGVIRDVTIPGDPVRYEVKRDHHHHFKCMQCQKVYEIEGCSDVLKKLVPQGYKPHSHELTFYGVCRQCA